MNQSIKTALPNNINELLREAETIFHDSLTKNIRAAFTDVNGVISTPGNAIISKINNAKTAAAVLVGAFKTEQTKATRGGYCRAALTAKADLVRLLNSQEYSAVIVEAMEEANRFMDVITLLWSANDEQ